MTRRKRIFVAVIVVGICLVGVTLYIAHFLKQNPLRSDGVTTLVDRSNVLIGLVNDGSSDITIQEVEVNGKLAKSVRLVMSYSGQLAMSGGIFEDSQVKFQDIRESSIRPELTPEEKNAALKLQTTPISYAISIKHDQLINTIKLKYKYFGIRFVRVIDLDPNSTATRSEPSSPSTIQVADSDSSQISFRLEKSKYRRGQEIHYSITNNSSYDVQFGEEYILEKYRKGTWMTVRMDDHPFPAIGYSLKPGATKASSLNLYDGIEVGQYRLLKAFSIQSGSDGAKVYIGSNEFKVG